ncbi:unnamed protein product [Polarella glacialis]|nr:unnamed protein product [Polarella glacialis]
MTESRTQPPPLLSEADLISAMDRTGIGTDATMHEHISKIQIRKYAIKNADDRLEPCKLGIALIEGVQRFALEEGIDLSKPQMRAEMEQGMAAIVRGEQRQDVFLQGALATVQRCYAALERNAPALDAALGQHFAGRAQVGRVAPIHAAAFSSCRCGASFDLRCHVHGADQAPGVAGADPGPGGRGRGRGRGRGAARGGRAGRAGGRAAPRRREAPAVVRQERFLVCPNGACGLVLPVPSKHTTTLSAYAHICPICQCQVLNVRNAETGRDHRLCPYCFNYVPQDLHPGLAELRCFQCAHTTCPLAGGRSSGGGSGGAAGSGGAGRSGGSSSLTPCGACGGQGSLVLRQNPRWCVQCSRSPACQNTLWLPSCVVAAAVDGLCGTCGPRLQCDVRTLSLRLATGHNAGALLAVGEDTLRGVCIAGCNDTLSRLGG